MEGLLVIVPPIMLTHMKSRNHVKREYLVLKNKLKTVVFIGKSGGDTCFSAFF